MGGKPKTQGDDALTTTIETNNPPDIMSAKPEDVKALHELTPNQFARLMVDAPPKADLLRAQAIRRSFWKNRNVKWLAEAVNAALSEKDAIDADGNSCDERTAMLLIMSGSANRRLATPRLAAAENELRAASELLSNIARTDADWAKRLEGAIEYEEIELLVPLGKYREAAKLGFRGATAQLQEAKPEKILDILFHAWRIAEMNAFDAGLKEGFTGGVSIRANAFMELLMAMTPKDDLFKRIQIALDMIRIAWLSGNYCDYSDIVERIGREIGQNQELKDAYDWSYRVMSGAVAFMRTLQSGSTDPYNLHLIIDPALEAARSIADDEDIGYSWRPEAMYAVIQLAGHIGYSDMADSYKRKLAELPNYHGSMLSLI